MCIEIMGLNFCEIIVRIQCGPREKSALPFIIQKTQEF